MESSLLLDIMCSPFAEKSMQFTRSVFSRKTFATRKDRKTSSVNFIAQDRTRDSSLMSGGVISKFYWAGPSFGVANIYGILPGRPLEIFKMAEHSAEGEEDIL